MEHVKWYIMFVVLSLTSNYSNFLTLKAIVLDDVSPIFNSNQLKWFLLQILVLILKSQKLEKNVLFIRVT